jgi:hypothetical protein
MKTLRKEPIALVEVETIPPYPAMKKNTMYYSEKYSVAVHLCLCGCGQGIAIIIEPGEWQIIRKDKLSVTPSLLHMNGCKSHYIITDGIANFV